MSFSYESAKQELREERAKLKQQLQRLDDAESKYENVGYGNHMADDATGAFDQAVDVALKRKINTTLHGVDRALAKFEDGTYGLCEACGARIERARLEILPHAEYCLDCQSRQEHSGIRVVSR
jgi:RNA polymerase-binding transcription factor DksA